MYTLQLFMDHLWNYQARLEVHDSVPWETLPTIWNHLELVTSEVSRQSEDFPIWDPKISLFWQNKEVISSSLLESLSGCSCSWNIKEMVKETAKKSQLGSELAKGSLKDFIFSWPEYFSLFLQKTAFSLVNSRLSLVSPGCSFVTRPKLPRTLENGCWLHPSDQSHRKSAFSRPDQTRSDQQNKRNDLLSQTWEFSSSSQQNFFWSN